MEPDLDRPAPAETPDQPAPTGIRPSRRRRIKTALNTTALLSTTAVLVAIEPKMPPLKGD
jgi:hypothetical protein